MPLTVFASAFDLQLSFNVLSPRQQGNSNNSSKYLFRNLACIASSSNSNPSLCWIPPPRLSSVLHFSPLHTCNAKTVCAIRLDAQNCESTFPKPQIRWTLFWLVFILMSEVLMPFVMSCLTVSRKFWIRSYPLTVSRKFWIRKASL